MIKYVQLLTFAVGAKSVTFAGREAFPVEDVALKASLLALGVFEEHEDGMLVYSGRVEVPLAAGGVAAVDKRGFLARQKIDLADPATDAFR